jgi:hypothetical protein
LKLTPPTPLSQDDIDKRLKATKKRLEEPLNQWRLSQKIAPAHMLAAAITMLEPTADDWQRYGEEIEKYLSRFETYLKEEIAYTDYLVRRIKLTFLLANDGNAPAEDIDVYVHFDGNFEVVLEEGLQAKPAAPKLPVKPSRKNLGLGHLPDFNSLYRSPTLPNFDFGTSNVSGFSVRKTNSEEVSGHVERIKQGTQIEIVDVYVIFPSMAEAKSFTLDYTLNSATLPNNLQGHLHVKIQHD